MSRQLDPGMTPMSMALPTQMIINATIYVTMSRLAFALMVYAFGQACEARLSSVICMIR
jgi:hypothetical protein